MFKILLLVVGIMSVSFTVHAGEDNKFETAIFAGGCFWCMEHPFDSLDGVISTTAGYTGGHTKDPTYEEVSQGNTGHAEAVQVIFDPSKVVYSKLLEVFWHNIDPTAENRQFCDVGSQYRAVIFYNSSEQQQSANDSKQALLETSKFSKITTEIVAASVFYPAEDYHQDYYRKNPLRYKFYRYSCGRDQKLRELWSND